MNSGLQRILSALFAVIAIYFIAWPYINGVMSHKYYYKAITEGSPNSVYISEFGKDRPLTVKVEHYNNLATQAEGHDTTEYELAIPDELLEKLISVSNYFRGGHIIFRQNAGYAMHYDANASSVSIFIKPEEQKQILEFSKILETLSRGDEIYDKKTKKTYQKEGEEELDKFMDKLGIV